MVFNVKKWYKQCFLFFSPSIRNYRRELKIKLSINRWTRESDLSDKSSIAQVCDVKSERNDNVLHSK